MGPNVCPSSCPSLSLQEPTEKQRAALLPPSESHMRLVALTLAYGPEIFERFLTLDTTTLLRLLHYPSLPPWSQLNSQEESRRS